MYYLCIKINKMRQYSITKKKNNGVTHNRVSFTKDGVRLLDITWNPDDKEAESKAIRSADMTVIRHKLNYKTRRLKPAPPKKI